MSRSSIYSIACFLCVALLVYYFFSSCSTGTHDSACDGGINISIVVETPQSNGVVYISGNSEKLGNWDGHGIPIDIESSRGRTTLCVDSNERIKFKITAGDWTREAIYKDGGIPDNFVIHAVQDTQLVIHIAKWKDDLELIKTGMTGDFDEYADMSYPGMLDRDVTVWLPPNYDDSINLNYPVLYMHDGQNVFNPNSSTMGIDWGVDEWADSLISNQAIAPIIVVAIDCTGDRYLDYSPGKQGETYMNFITQKLKPVIDSTYRTKPDRNHTTVMGASMGGLISFMMHWRHNSTFGKAACLSPAFVYQGLNYPKVVGKYKGKQKMLDVYIVNGTEGLEKTLQPGCDQMMETLDDVGYAYEWLLDDGAKHNEEAWNKRVGEILVWMFGK